MKNDCRPNATSWSGKTNVMTVKTHVRPKRIIMPEIEIIIFITSAKELFFNEGFVLEML